MSRRVFVTNTRIWEARSFWYADHYQKRQLASQYPADAAERTLKALAGMPTPRLTLMGALDTWNYDAIRAIPIQDKIMLLRHAQTPSELFVSWYWSDEQWQCFIHQFNGLPDPEPVYEMTMQGDYPHLEPVPYLLARDVDKLGTTAELSLVVPKNAAKSKLSRK